VTFMGMMYLLFVRNRMKHIALGGLLATYLVLTCGAHVQVFATVLNSGGEPQQVTSAKKRYPGDSRPVWVVKKHLLSNTKKVEPPTEAELPCTDFAPTSVFLTFQTRADSTESLHSVYLPYRPRDPPSR